MPIRPENRHRYPADWPAISLRIRTERAAGHCECHGECGRGTHNGRCPNRNGQPAYGTGSKVVLTVAHLDHTPEHSDDTNLRAMCQGCHLHYDRDHHRHTAATTRRAAIETAGQLALDLTPENINTRRKRLLTQALHTNPDDWTPDRVQALYAAHGDHVDINTCWGWLRHLTVVEPVITA